MPCRWVKDAKAAASLNVTSVKKVTRDYTGDLRLRPGFKQNDFGAYRLSLNVVHNAAEDDRKFVSIIGFECRGMDVTNWHPEVSISLQQLLMSMLQK